jgi:hypothetical protein
VDDSFETLDSTFAIAPVPDAPTVPAAPPVGVGSLVPGDEAGLGTLLNVANGAAAEAQQFVEAIEPANVNTQGLGLNSAAGQAINIVNTHGAAVRDALEGDFRATERIAGWAPFFEANAAGQAAWRNATDGLRFPGTNIAETNISIGKAMEDAEIAWINQVIWQGGVLLERPLT